MDSSNIRKVQRSFDDGGPLLIWNDARQDQPHRKGMILCLDFCHNPECRFAHFHAIAIDERYDDIQYDGVQLSYSTPEYEHVDTRKTSISGSYQIDDRALSVTEQHGSTTEIAAMVTRLSETLQTDQYNDLVLRRFRHSKNQDRDAWRQKDWSWLEPGEVLCWSDVYEDDPNFIFKAGSNSCIAMDMYCIAPGCRCRDVVVAMYEYGERMNSIGAIRVDIDKWVFDDKDAGKNKPRVRDCWQALLTNYPDLKATLKQRYRAIKKIGPDILRISGNLPEMPARSTGAKTGRNDPCPCGSGKKYKKCCLA